MSSLATLISALLCFQGPAIEPDLDVALGTLGLNARTARFDESLLRLFRKAEFTSPLYAAIHENPWRTPLYAETFRRELGSQAATPAETITTLGRTLGTQTRRSLIGNVNASAEESTKKPGALAVALQNWRSLGLIDSPVPKLDAVPPEVQSAAALLLTIIPRSLEFRKLAVLQLGNLDAAHNRLSGPKFTDSSPSESEQRRKLLAAIDLPYLFSGSYDLAAAAHVASLRIASVTPERKYSVRIPTKLGVIHLTGGDARLYPNDQALLIVDTGGTDTYLGQPSTKSAGNPVSIVIDSDGNDSYLSDSELINTEVSKFSNRTSGVSGIGPGCAVMGYSILLDLKGNDLYRSHKPGVASAKMGVSLLFDFLGDDTYDAYSDSMAFAMGGMAILSDFAGKDRYDGFSQVQGCGQTLGVAALIDRGGDDTYVANHSELDFPSAQSAQHNLSMAQGAGNGKRGDYLDGHSFDGGVGVLLDEDGNDSYTCGVFGQGVGYWGGVGMLLDNKGDDRYNGHWYVQGASAHFAIGIIEDVAGNDTYNAAANMALGAGHDFGLGVMFDREGNDSYTGPNLSLGSGNANGIGWAVDFQGNDRYVSTGLTLGSAAEAPKTSLRVRALCLGVFMDLAGDDIYPEGTSWAKNAARTAQVKDRGPTPAESQFGVFWDR